MYSGKCRPANSVAPPSIAGSSVVTPSANPVPIAPPISMALSITVLSSGISKVPVMPRGLTVGAVAAVGTGCVVATG